MERGGRTLHYSKMHPLVTYLFILTSQTASVSITVCSIDLHTCFHKSDLYSLASWLFYLLFDNSIL